MQDIFHVPTNSHPQQLRAITINNSFWFILDDVRELLGYRKISDIPHFQPSYVDFYKPEELSELGISGILGIQIIPAGYGLRLICEDQKPGLETTKAWVIDEVFPALMDIAFETPKSETPKPENKMPEATLDNSDNTQGKDIAIFQNPAFGSIRSIMRGGEPWFVANDVAAALGYAWPKNAVADHCKYAELFKGGDLPPLTESPHGITIIPEADLYALIFRSNLPKAEQFRDWVYSEVLPSIRKTGKYAVEPEATPETNTDWESLRGKIDAMKVLLEKADAGKKASLIVLGELIKKETGFDALEACHMDLSIPLEEPTLTTAQIAELAGCSFTESGVLFNLTMMGLLRCYRREYELTPEGKKYGVELPTKFVGRCRYKKVILDFVWKPIVADLIRIYQKMTHCAYPILSDKWQ